MLSGHKDGSLRFIHPCEETAEYKIQPDRVTQNIKGHSLSEYKNKSLATVQRNVPTAVGGQDQQGKAAHFPY
jgi:hypothetical protein